MQTSQPSLFARDHTILGVCEGLGEDLGINPTLLRIPFAVFLLLSPVAVISTYLACGVLVFLTRRISPNPAAVAAEPAAIAEPARSAAANQVEEEFAVAA